MKKESIMLIFLCICIWTCGCADEEQSIPAAVPTIPVDPAILHQNESIHRCCYNGICADIWESQLCDPANMSGKTATPTTSIPHKTFTPKQSIAPSTTIPIESHPTVSITFINYGDPLVGNESIYNCCFENMCRQLKQNTICDKYNVSNQTIYW